MADNKLSWTELRRALATRADVSEKEANLFLNALNAQLIEALRQDKQVKINGLGIFRLQAVAPRKSVNVTSGEQIIIEGYNKIAFVPEAGVKELVEKIGDQQETVAAATPISELIDPIQKLGAQAEEIMDILGELGQRPNEEGVQRTEEGIQRTEDSVQTDNEPVVEPEPIKEPVVQEAEEQAVQAEEPVVKEPEIPMEPEKQPAPEIEKQPEVKTEKGKKQYHFVRDTLICVVILLMLLLVGYFFLRHQISVRMDEWANGKAQTEVIEAIEADEVIVDESDSFIDTEAVVVTEDESTGYGELLLTENIPEGSRLAWISKKYYGNIVYWPYLYEANKDRISNPSLITVGTPIRVPKLTAAQRDTTTVAFQRLKEQAYGAVK